MNRPPESSSAATPRAEAARIVERWMRDRVFPDRLLDDARSGRAFVTEAVYGVVRNHSAIEWMLRRFAREVPAAPVAAPMFVAVYELAFLDDSAPYAAVDAAVDLVKARADVGPARFANAVLRRIAGAREELRRDLGQQPPEIRFSHPAALIARWTAAFGADGARRLCEWNNGRAGIIVRVDTARTTMAAMLDEFARAGLRAEPHPFDPARFARIGPGAAARDLPGLGDGRIHIQDPATAMPADLLAPEPGEIVLDACAAPGGKTVLMAGRMQGRGTLIALEARPERLARLRENLDRHGLQRVRTVLADATRPDPAALAALEPACAGGFDAILLDVPCSATGVIRRRPDARWSFGPEKLRTLNATQSALLDGAAPLLKPGGRMVYSTCSLEAEENERMVEGWIAESPAARPASGRFELADSRRLFPPDSGTDGAFAALLRRPA